MRREMKRVIQRVPRESVTLEGEVKGAIDKGFLVLLGVGQDDTEEIVDKYVKKMTGLRIFDDEEGKTNLSLSQVNGSVLMISQFTLYANCKKGNRPSFIEAGDPEKANALYEYAIAKTKEVVPNVQRGVFGADMKVELLNDGPFTIVLEGLE